MPTFVLALQEGIKRFCEVLTRENPSFLRKIPKPEVIDKAKATKISLTGDNCNTARLTKYISNNRLGGKCHDVGFHNHS